MKFGEVSADEIFARVTPTVNVEAVVADIIADVRENGDAALYKYCEKFDGARLDSLLVSEAEIDEAMAASEGSGVTVIPGIELSTEYEGKDIHIVGLLIDKEQPAFKNKIQEFVNSRILRNQKMCQKLMKKKEFTNS